MVGEVVAPRYRQSTVLSVEDTDPPGEEVSKVQTPPEKGKGDLYNPNECWRCGGMGTLCTGVYAGHQPDKGHRKASPYFRGRNPNSRITPDGILQ